MFRLKNDPPALQKQENLLKNFGLEKDTKLTVYLEDAFVESGSKGWSNKSRIEHLKEMADLLEARGIDVKYAIHPVAGRMPGHMNVLLAEAGVDYDNILDLDEINPEFPTADVALVIGANDVVNPVARSNPDSPIYGMPILDADKAHNTIVIKRGKGAGFSGIENHLFYADNTQMLYGDGQKAVAELIAGIKALQ